MKLAALFLASCLALSRASGAEAELVDFDSFVNPDVLGGARTQTDRLLTLSNYLQATTSQALSFTNAESSITNLLGGTEERYHLLSTTVLMGMENHYQFRNEYVDVSDAFLRAANNFYRPPWQVGLDLTARRPLSALPDSGRSRFPLFKAHAEFSYYFAV